LILKVSGKGVYKNKVSHREWLINVAAILHWLNADKSPKPLWVKDYVLKNLRCPKISDDPLRLFNKAALSRIQDF
jgi:hypothetical protein